MQSSRFIYMGTQSHTHLNEDDITEHLHLCDTSELNLKNVVEKKTCSKCTEDSMLRQHDYHSTHINDKTTKQLFESLPNYYLGILRKKKGVLSVIGML